MAYVFEYHGGVVKPTTHTVEKFLLFFVVDGREIPIHQLIRDGLVMKLSEKGNDYTTGLTVAKLFVGQQGFGIPKKYHSFYFRFVEDKDEMVTVRPFGGQKLGLAFRAKIRFLNRAQTLGLLGKDCESRPFVERQAPLPLDTLRAMITVERVEDKDVRHVRIRQKAKSHLHHLPLYEEEGE